ncbi:hypothetical protein [Streptomyces axinellae]
MGESNFEAKGSGGGDKQTTEAKVSRVKKVVVEGDKGGGAEALTPRDSNWEAPACWYEPTMSPKEVKALMKKYEPEKREKKKESGGLIPGDSGDLVNALQRQSESIMKGYFQTDKYKNYNMAKQGKGMFWEGVRNPEKVDDPKSDDCTQQAIWVDKGDTPDVPNPVSPKVLAESVYDSLPIPDTDVSLNPEGRQTVNLKTWAWLDKAKFKPVKVGVSLPGTGLWAETTAEPYALTLEPGTDQAETFPAGAKCVVEDGRIGAPYTKGKAKQTPPCGLTYLKATPGGQSYELKATLIWKVSWKGTGGAGAELPQGEYGEGRSVRVREVQSIVRD